MTWLLIVVVPVVAMYLIWSTTHVGAFAPSAIFVGTNALAAIGIFPLLDPDLPADHLHGEIIAYSLIAFCVCSAVVESPIPRMVVGYIEPYRPKAVAGFIVVMCVLVTVAYFAAVGYSAFLLGLKNAFTGGSADVAGLRLDSYAGNRYLFPGYVNQLKNVLLPGLVFVTAAYWFQKKDRHWVILVPLVAFSLFGLLGTGQRGAFVMFVATLVVVTYLRTGRTFSRKGVTFALIGVLVLMLSTFALGRQKAELTAVGGGVAKSGVLLKQISDRVLGQSGAGHVAGFRYIYSYKVDQHGTEWARDAVGLLPGTKGSTIANEIFAYQWGSTRGNSPPSIWASIYLNFGLGGIAAAPLILAVLMGMVTRSRQRMVKRANTLSLLGVAGVSVCLGFWTAGSPIFLLNTGIVVYALMWAVGQRTLTPQEALPVDETGGGLAELPRGRVPVSGGAQPHRASDPRQGARPTTSAKASEPAPSWRAGGPDAQGF